MGFKMHTEHLLQLACGETSAVQVLSYRRHPAASHSVRETMSFGMRAELTCGVTTQGQRNPGNQKLIQHISEDDVLLSMGSSDQGFKADVEGKEKSGN